MRTFYWIITLVLFSLPVLASQPTNMNPDCRLNDIPFNAELSMVQLVKDDLVSGVWHKQSATLLFNDSGLASVITDCATGGKNVTSLRWNVVNANGNVVLELNGTQHEAYIVNQTCDGLTLVDPQSGAEEQMEFTPKSKATKMMAAQRTLSGEWNSTVYPNTIIEDLEAQSKQEVVSAYFKYELHDDGTFVKTFGGQNLQTVRVSGIWQVSEDGKYVILHLPDGEGDYYNRVAEIKYLALDELVLDQPFGISELESRLCAEMRTFYFNKQ